MISTSSELYINLKSIPDVESEEYDAFFLAEREKMDKGVIIAGTHIPGWLYWHTNHWHIVFDRELPGGGSERIRQVPTIRDSEWLIAEALQQAEVQQKGLIIIGTRRFGKELWNASKLYTETGEIEIGDAKVGNRIYGADGQLTTITDVFPQGTKPIYEVSLRNGTKLYAGLEHQWKVFDRDKRRYVILQTKDMIDRGVQRTRIHNGYKNKVTRTITEAKYWLPINQPVLYPNRELTIDPYFLGQWLGDGTSANLAITTIDPETIKLIYDTAESYGYIVTIDNKGITYSIRTGTKRKRWGNILWNKFVAYNLRSNKHIPFDYLHASFDQRLALLQGLMDSDGTCGVGGTISFSNTNRKLIEDVYQLCRSLGIACHLADKKTTCRYKGILKKSISYVLSLHTDLPVFRLKRKLDRMCSGAKTHQPRKEKDAVVSIKYAFDAPATCIMVDNKDHLFLTDDYTVTHNSEFAASFLARNATIYKYTENVLTGGNSKDINVIARKCDLGLVHLHPFFKHPRTKQNWANQVEFGVKEKSSGEVQVFSSIEIRNFKDGTDTEAAAGTTAKTFIMDEIGKFPFAQCFAASKPAFSTPFGWRCIPVLTGTGGSFEKGDDAKRMFWEPESYNFLSVDLEGGRKSGIFVPGHLSLDVPKHRTTLAAHLKLPAGTDLDNIPIDVADWEEGERAIDEMRDEARKSSDPSALLKVKMYYPKDPDECFLTSGGNPFPIEAAQQHLNHLRAQQLEGTLIHLYKDTDGRIQRKFAESHERPISEFPVKPDTYKSAPIQIFEFPEPNAPYGLYIAGADPYNQASASTSESLGSVYIYKRTSDIIGEGYQDMLVAAYTARPPLMETWHANVEMLLEFYNAVCMPENEGATMIQWFATRNKSHLLADGLNFLREISPNTTVTRTKGLPATVKVIDHCMNLAVEYCNEQIQVGHNELTGEPISRLGVTRILDPMLLEEIIKYNEKGNFDRIVAWRHVLAYASYLDKYYPIVKVKMAERPEMVQRKIPSSPFYSAGGFSKGRSPFIKV